MPAVLGSWRLFLRMAAPVVSTLNVSVAADCHLTQKIGLKRTSFDTQRSTLAEVEMLSQNLTICYYTKTCIELNKKPMIAVSGKKLAGLHPPGASRIE